MDWFWHVFEAAEFHPTVFLAEYDKAELKSDCLNSDQDLARMFVGSCALCLWIVPGTGSQSGAEVTQGKG